MSGVFDERLGEQEQGAADYAQHGERSCVTATRVVRDLEEIQSLGTKPELFKRVGDEITTITMEGTKSLSSLRKASEYRSAEKR